MFLLALKSSNELCKKFIRVKTRFKLKKQNRDIYILSTNKHLKSTTRYEPASNRLDSSPIVKNISFLCKENIYLNKEKACVALLL